MKKFIIGVILFCISITAFIPLAIWGIVEVIISMFYKRKFFKSLSIFGEFITLLAILVDVTLNVLMQIPFNRILIDINGYQFGSRKDTISDVLGVNKRDKTLKKGGKILCGVLNFLDKDHCLKSIDE